MVHSTQEQVTRILARIGSLPAEGSIAAELLPLDYDELRRLAQSHLRQRGGSANTLQATALVHEVYLKLVGSEEHRWENRAHFFAVAATAMRQILANHVRDKKAVKRGGGQLLVTLCGSLPDPAAETPGLGPSIELVELHRALERLAELDPDQYRVVELRFFTGMTVEEISAVTGVSPATVKREWRAARAWLNDALSGSPFPNSGDSQ